MRATGLPAWQSSQPGQVGNQAALTVESVPGSRLVTLLTQGSFSINNLRYFNHLRAPSV